MRKRRRRKRRHRRRHGKTNNRHSVQTNNILSPFRRRRNKHHHRRKTRQRDKMDQICDTVTPRLIEKCSWPQCNKSCPKLLNPMTGQELEFKDLLQSFGLDMPSMARALGIDLHTLNSMDHRVLLHVLTQHS